MTRTTDSKTLHYLPVEVAGQVFAIPMADVVAVHWLGDAITEGDVSPQSNGSPQDRVPVIDVRHLFWGLPSPGPRVYAVVVATDAGTCALLVEGIRAARAAEASTRHPFPRLAAIRGNPFSGVLCESDALVLIVNGQYLVRQLQQAAEATDAA